MRFVVNQKKFLEMVYRAQSVVEKKTTMPILSHVLIKAEDGRLHTASTDLEMSLQESCEVMIEESGSVALPVVLLHEILRKLPSESDITVSKDANEPLVHIKTGNSRFKLPCLESSDFPNIKINTDLAYKFTVSPSKFLEGIDMVRFSISADEKRYNLAGIFLHTSVQNGENCLDMVASDGHRLTHAVVPLIEYTENMPGILISRKMSYELFSILSKSDTPIVVSFSENQIVFEQNDLVFISRLVDATFPPYQEMIPQCSYSGTINAKVFLDALERISPIVSHEKAPYVYMTLSGEMMKLFAPAQEYGEATDELLVNYNGPEISLMMNLRYLIDIVSRLKDTEVQIDFESASVGIIISDMQNPGVFCILMPMRG